MPGGTGHDGALPFPAPLHGPRLPSRIRRRRQILREGPQGAAPGVGRPEGPSLSAPGAAAPHAAIFFHPEAYSTDMPRLMGRNAAGESFLKGYLAHAGAAEFWACAEAPGHADAFRAQVAAAGRREPVTVLDRAATGRLAQAGTLFYPGPDLGGMAARRALFGDTAWSLSGITHTTSSARAMDAITGLLSGHVQPWDALVCTSRAVRANVEHLLAAEMERLRRRFNATRFTLPQMPVIPLGIDTARLAATPDQRAEARAAIGAGVDAVVVLFMGRLSFHAKAHPLAMYRALETVARGDGAGRSIVLVECGWFANADIEKAFDAAAATACPSVRVVRLDGRTESARRTAWAGADIFCSLSDNIQETFGITPVEAMAAGLPVVVSDWDGYRDTVREGTDGFRVPTLMPAPGLGRDLAIRHALEVDTYDHYCGRTAAFVAVDVEATAAALARLVASPDLRRRMGEAGRRRARNDYDWARLVPRYEALWSELAAIRRAAPSSGGWPARPDPFAAFAGYPTRRLDARTRLALADGLDAAAAKARVASDLSLVMVDYARHVLPDAQETSQVLDAAAAGPRRAGELVEAIAPARRPHVLRALAWMAKLGVLKVTP